MTGTATYRQAVQAVDDGRLVEVLHGPVASERIRPILPTLPATTVVALAVVVLEELGEQYPTHGIDKVLAALEGRVTPVDAAEASLLLRLTDRIHGRAYGTALRVALAAAGRLPADQVPPLAEDLRQAEDRLAVSGSTAAARSQLLKEIARLRATAAVTTSEARVDAAAVARDDGWGVAAAARLATVTTGVDAVTALLWHLAATASGPRPGSAWVKRAAELAVPVDPALIRDLLDDAVSCTPLEVERNYETEYVRLDVTNATLVRGLVWVAASRRPAWFVPVVSALGAHHVDDNLAVANAAIAALGAAGTPEAVAALARIRRRTRNRSTVKQIDSAVAEAAAAAGLSPAELLELTVPDCGLGPEGTYRVRAGAATAVLGLGAAGRAEQFWEVDGVRATRAPAGVDAEFTRSVRRELADLKEVVAAERARLDDLLIEPREWPLERWVRHYHEHPVTGRLSGHMVWVIADADAVRTGMPVAASSPVQFTGPDGVPFGPEPGSVVRPWHPATAPADLVHAWRDRLMAMEITQPVRQVFRESYLLTPAELATGTYSNRFAAHVLRYRQLYALLKERRWSGTHLGIYDRSGPDAANREFASHGLRARLRYEATAVERGDTEVEYCTTGQVMFTRLGERHGDPVPLADVPPLVLSEAMRDVDLFVGVTSIATDPTWADRRDEPLYAYWSPAALAELTDAGRTRRDVIARLLPKLRIRDRCRLDGRYLEVTGRRHVYRIHLGSANILMSPNDTYLCIVPAQKAAVLPGARFVPVEGDTLLTLILSKALLLADDHRITDPDILAQFERGGRVR